jgi:flagellar biosynthesis/type III secretory pathway M-ring protein FliF/YscJ
MKKITVFILILSTFFISCKPKTTDNTNNESVSIKISEELSNHLEEQISELIKHHLGKIMNPDRIEIRKCNVQINKEKREVKNIEVAVNILTISENNKKYPPLSKADLDYVERIIKGCVGYNQERGDVVIVTNE